MRFRTRSGWTWLAGLGLAAGLAAPAAAQYYGTDTAPHGTPSAPAGSCASGSCPDAGASCQPAKEGWWRRCKHHLQACFLGFPDQFEARPLGDAVYSTARVMVANGEEARMVLYHADFVEGSDQLNPRGRDQLAKITQLLPQNFAPVVIERTPCAPGLDEARRLAVLNELGRCAFPIPPERVVIGPPVALGMSGMEAAIVEENMRANTRSGGTRAGASPGSIGGTVGQGFGATGR